MVCSNCGEDKAMYCASCKYSLSQQNKKMRDLIFDCYESMCTNEYGAPSRSIAMRMYSVVSERAGESHSENKQ